MLLCNKRILCIGGFDPGGHAGVLADARMVEHLGGQASCLISLDTAQGRRHFAQSREPALPWLQQQWQALQEDGDSRFAAIKLGALGGAEQARWLSQQLAGFTGPIVLDPVIASSSGGTLGDPAVLRSLASRATLITPNRAELLALYPQAEQPDWQPPAESPALLVTGTDAAQQQGRSIVDHHLYYQGEQQRLQVRLRPGRYRGSGCLLASALACALAAGQTIPAACRFALDEMECWLDHAEQHADGIHHPRPQR